jgi:hypothetical protein
MKIVTPQKSVATPPKGNKGGPGTYDGEKGYPPRTRSSGAPPEKVRDKCGGKY